MIHVLLKLIQAFYINTYFLLMGFNFRQMPGHAYNKKKWIRVPAQQSNWDFDRRFSIYLISALDRQTDRQTEKSKESETTYKRLIDWLFD